MSVAKDLTGLRFGKLLVVGRDENRVSTSGSKVSRWRCLCDCGNEKTTDGYSLTSGRCKSCGCLKRQRSSENGKKNGALLVGKRFGKLTVLASAEHSIKNNKMWICECDCGKRTEVTTNDLTQGKVKSCGCLKIKTARDNCISRKKHGMTNTRLYHIWNGMKQRTLNPNTKAYAKYGERGIGICKEWEESFESFAEWALNNGYRDDLSIDRINNDGNYEPDNCRWADWSTQNKNRSKFTRKGKK